MEYKLIAFDMDGTLLNSKKEISPKTLEAIKRASDAGKIVVFDTGRCIPELLPYLDAVPQIHYAVCGSGSMIFDMRTKKVLFSHPIDVETVRKILEISKMEDLMVHILSDKSIVEYSKISIMEHFGLGKYKNLFENIVTSVDNIYDWFEKNPVPLEKINLHHATTEGRERTRNRILPFGLSLADAEESSLEISAKGVDKGSGLLELCKILKIDISETIAVGDSDNDLLMLKTAGLAIAIGNANENAKAAAKFEVADCDSDGCAEAIEKYLLV